MKQLILSISGMLLLAIQTNAQDQPMVKVDVSPKITTVNTNLSYNVNTDFKINTTVNVQDQDQDGDDPMKTKTFTKSFSLDKSDKVNLSNQYGSITIKTWDKNEIKVDADIKAYANNDAEAQKLLDNASIIASKTGDLVSFKTAIENRNSNSWNWGSGSKNGKKWRREVKVHITVYMPASSSLTAAQSYGSITMDNFSGPTSLKVQYGNLTAGNLSNDNNYISVSYGKAVAKDIDRAKIKLQYGGGLIINSIGTLDLDAEYTSVNIGTIKTSAVIKHQYGKGITIGTAGNLNLNTQYTGVKVANLKGNVTSKQDYGQLNIAAVEATAKVIDINGNYSSVNLAFSSTYSGEFDVTVNYGDFKYGSNVTAKKHGDDRDYSNSKRYSGQVGKGGSGKISVITNYESITFN